jgi:glycosyltransferase involved in cell wall biosynthesis
MPTVCWRLSAWGPDIASTRYRAAIPALHLVRHGVASRFSWGRYGFLEPGPPDVLVFVKTFSDRDLQLAREAAAAGVAVVLDVCDNVFAPGYRAHSPGNLRRMAELAAAVVTTGPALAGVLRTELRDGLPLHEVPDPVETPPDVRATVRLLWRARLGRALNGAPADLPLAAAAAVRRELMPALRRRHAGAAAGGRPQVLWFGNAGSVEPRFGIVNLVDIAEELEAAHAEVPFRLLVVTGTRDAYRERIAPLALDTAFAPWDRMTVFRHVRDSAAVIVPNSRDAFSVCKSANRPVLALAQGVPVVASRIPSLEPLDGAVAFDDFRAGLVTYLRDHDTAREHVHRGRAVIEREFAPAVVAGRWRHALAAAIGA